MSAVRSAALPAKASIPRATNALARARVFRVLDRALARGAAWIAAPAGAGKTTAVASHLRARRRTAVWYDVDATDADCANVFIYLAQALRATTRSKRRLPAFQVQHLGSLRAFAHKFFEGFFAALPAGGVLVLDNCHAMAESDAWHQILDEATRAVPDGRALVIVSRREPPSLLARSVLNERLVLVTGNELRFTEAEAGALARARLPAPVRRQAGSIRKLCDLAGGWAAGLVLVLDHAARGESRPGLGHHDERLFDYFSAEVLAELPPESQRLLQATALLPCMTDAMATAVSGAPEAGTFLADLHRRGLLVERLATVPISYRYHPLLRAFLLAREAPSPDLLAKAAAACEMGGFLDDAVELHARAGARDRIAALVLEHAPRLVAEGRYGTLAAWLARIDEAGIAAEPWLRFWQATANVLLDQSASRARFDEAFESFRRRGDAAGLYLSIAGAAQVIFLESEDFRRFDPWFRRFSELRMHGPPPPSDDVEARALTTLLMATCYVRPSHPDLSLWVDRALALAPSDTGARLRLWSAVVMCHSITGRFEAAADLLAGMQPDATRVPDPATRMMIHEAEIHRSLIGAWRDLLEAGQRALAIARAEGLLLFEPTNLTACAQAHAFGGDEVAADDYLRQAAEAAARTPGAHLFRVGLYQYTQAILAFCAGRFDEAIGYLDSCLSGALRTGGRWPEILVRALRCVALTAQLRDEDARQEAAMLVGEATPVGATGIAVELAGIEPRLRACEVAAEGEASRALERARSYGSYTLTYLRGLPEVVACGLRDPAHRSWLREYLLDHRMKPAPQHLDLEAWPFGSRVRTLGGFAFEGPAAARRSHKVQKAPLRLLKVLVAAGGRELSASAVCEALWADDAPGSARRKLDTTLHRLRALLGDDVVSLTGGALTIDRARCFVDAWAFASLADRAAAQLRRAGATGPGARALTLFDEAVRLYRGDFLSDEDDLPQVIVHRERLRRRFIGLVLDFAGALESSAGERAIAVCESALEVDDQAPSLWLGLMRAQLAGGRPREAVKAFERCQLALHARGGAGPNDELRALRDQARSQMALRSTG